MNFETTRWMKNVMTGAENSIKRIDNHTLRSKHKLELVQMLGEMQTALEEEKADNTTITSMIDHLKSMQDILTSPTPEVKALTELSERINDGLQELDKINYIYAALQLDIVSITPLEEQIAQKKEELRQMFQGAVDIDLKQYGKISDVTGSALEAFHFVLIDNRILSASDILPEQKPEELKELENGLFANGARYDNWKTEADLLRFMVETDLELYGSISPSMAEQLSESGYEYADGNIRSINPKQDVTTESILADSTMSPMAEQLIAENAAADRAKSAVQQNRQYLNIPPQPKDQFSNTIKYLKENGARFDQEKKAWYISGKADAEKFKDYLKGSLVDKIHRKHTEVHKADNAGDGKSQNEQLKTRSAKETER